MSTKAEDTQKNILDTARKHFLRDGLTGASLRNIVKDAGLTTGAFYKYYPTKESLFDALTVFLHRPPSFFPYISCWTSFPGLPYGV